MGGEPDEGGEETKAPRSHRHNTHHSRATITGHPRFRWGGTWVTQWDRKDNHEKLRLALAQRFQVQLSLGELIILKIPLEGKSWPVEEDERISKPFEVGWHQTVPLSERKLSYWVSMWCLGLLPWHSGSITQKLSLGNLQMPPRKQCFHIFQKKLRREGEGKNWSVNS